MSPNEHTEVRRISVTLEFDRPTLPLEDAMKPHYSPGGKIHKELLKYGWINETGDTLVDFVLETPVYVQQPNGEYTAAFNYSRKN